MPIVFFVVVVFTISKIASGIAAETSVVEVTAVETTEPLITEAQVAVETTISSTTEAQLTVIEPTTPPTTEAQVTVVETTSPPTTEAQIEIFEDTDYSTNEFSVSKGENYTSYGTFRLTAYCPCYECSGSWGKQTSSGTWCVEGRTVACNSIPAGTRIYIEGYGEFVVEDTGNLGSRTIDIYFDDHRANFEDYREVYVLE